MAKLFFARLNTLAAVDVKQTHVGNQLLSAPLAARMMLSAAVFSSTTKAKSLWTGWNALGRKRGFCVLALPFFFGVGTASKWLQTPQRDP